MKEKEVRSFFVLLLTGIVDDRKIERDAGLENGFALAVRGDLDDRINFLRALEVVLRDLLHGGGDTAADASLQDSVGIDRC